MAVGPGAGPAGPEPTVTFDTPTKPRPGPLVPRPPRHSGPEVFPWRFVAILLGLTCMGIYAWFWVVEGQATGSGLLVVPVLLMLTAPLFARAARGERAFDLAGLLATGLLLRFLAAYYRFDNAVDGLVYSKIGAQLAPSFRHLDFGADVGAPIPGTGSLRFLSGWIQVFTGSNRFATFLVFAWLSFWGCYLLYRAFRTALPEGDRYRYARLIFLWPSVVFWPSSIGKESVMLLAIGIAALGTARVFVRRSGGYTLFFLGTGGAFLVRPHMAMILLGAFVVALVLGRRNVPASRALTPAVVAKVAAVVLLLVVASMLAARTARFLGVENLQPTSAQSALEETQGLTEQGGSRFSPIDSTSAVGYPQAVVTILFRPFLFEVGGFEQLLTSIEALCLALLAIGSGRRLGTLLWRWREEPYVGFSLVFVLVFVFVFAAISNFGILARERVQMLPFAFVLLSVAASARPRKGASAAPSVRGVAG